MQITFLGAADTVTGSRHLVDAGGARILLDCGLFQGFKTLRERNWAPFAVDPASIDAVVLSHAHLDHCGYLPALVKQGFKGRVYASPATIDLCEVMLLDSAHLQEEDARRANRVGSSRHAPALALYTVADAKRALARLVPLAPGRSTTIGAVRVALTPVGHLLGACAVTLQAAGTTLVYSGDLGRGTAPDGGVGIRECTSQGVGHDVGIDRRPGGDAHDGTERRGPNRWFGRGQGVDDGVEVAAVTGEDHGLAVGVRDARRRTGRVVGGWVGDRIGHGAVSVAVGSDRPRGVTGVAGVSGRLPFSQPPGRMSPLGRVHP